MPPGSDEQICATAGVQSEILGQLLAAHTVLQWLPGRRRTLEFVTHALLIVPGVRASAAMLWGEELEVFDGDWAEARAGLQNLPPPRRGAGYVWRPVPGNSRLLVLELGTHQQELGCLCLLCSHPERVESYLPFLINLAGSAALTLENRAQRQVVEEANERLLASQREYELLFQEMGGGFAVHEIIVDSEGKAIDYRFLTVNKAFERLTGLQREKVIGRTARQVLPELESEWIETYGEVALKGSYVRFENYSGSLDRHYEVVAYSPSPGKFATIFNDITERKKQEEQLGQAAAEMEEAYRREHEVAEYLQMALLPEVPEIAGLEIDVVYESASDLSLVGGDFYDVLALPDGRIMIAVGDVCGKGVPAAKLMATVRHTIRAGAADGLSPGDWLTEVGRRLEAVGEPAQFVTAALVVIDPASSRLEYSLAGHPPPLLVSSNGPRYLKEAVGIPLGAGQHQVYEVAAATFYPGDVLVLYTDGLTEARYEGRQYGFESFMQAAGALRHQAVSGKARSLVEDARTFSRGQLKDDTVVVLLKMLF